MKKIAAMAGVFVLLATFAAFTPQLATAAPPHSSSLAIPVTGTVNTGGTFNGIFTLTGFALQSGQLVANGILTGTVTNGTAVTSILQTVTAAITSTATSSCTILHLDLGPINLKVLGLQITTNEIVLDISAIPGPGNLLGNLLCDIANLLNNPNQTLVGLLNNVVSILRGL